VRPDEVESQLSAMFDGELPAAECELLSRRIDRDEKLRARWARYVLIGASMRYEPVAIATAVNALERDAMAPKQVRSRAWLRSPRLVWQSALAAGLVVAVAGLSITLLRDAALNSTAQPVTAERGAAAHGPTLELAGAFERGSRPVDPAAVPSALSSSAEAPWSYVTPAGNDRSSSPVPLRSELADYIVAHSDYSAPLMRPDLLSALVSGGQGSDDIPVTGGAPSSGLTAGATPGTGENDAATAAPSAHP
jgi:sigma-E factor negative regulatory protein RseA